MLVPSQLLLRNSSTNSLPLKPISITSCHYQLSISLNSSKILLMSSEIKPPREFKFVGAFSRKRRRHNVPNTTKPTDIVNVITSPSPAPRSSGTPSRSKLGVAAMRRPAPNAISELHSTGAASCVASDGAATAETILPAPTPVIQADDIDWSYTSLLNPFIDSGLSFGTSFDGFGGHDQLPMYFEPDLPLPQFNESPLSLEDSPLEQPTTTFQQNNTGMQQQDSTVDDGTMTLPLTEDVNKTTLPPFSSQEESSNISLTVAQLLSRCTYPTLIHSIASSNPLSRSRILHHAPDIRL